MIRFVPGVGCLNPDIAIIGEAPGREEEDQGIPFVGRSGEIINQIMHELNISRRACYITNAVKFRPTNEDNSNRTPTDEEIDKYYPLLYEELKLVNPKITICLGSTAYKALSGNRKLKITQDRGNVYNSVTTDDEMNIISKFMYLPTFHPSFILRYPDKYEILKSDFQKALDYVKNNT